MPDVSDTEIGFETALDELTGIVAELEQGGPDLTGALRRYERGVHLLGRCQGLLNGAERSVALLTGVDESGKPITAPFDGSATAVILPTVAPTPTQTAPPLPPAPAPAPRPKKAKAAPAASLLPAPPEPGRPAWPEGDVDETGPPW